MNGAFPRRVFLPFGQFFFTFPPPGFFFFTSRKLILGFFGVRGAA
jgi:hypothetical protein